MKKKLIFLGFFILVILLASPLYALSPEYLPKTNQETSGMIKYLEKYWVEITTLITCFIIGLLIRFLTEKIDSSFDEGIFYGLYNLIAFGFTGFIVFLVNYHGSGFRDYFLIGFTALGAYAFGWGPGAVIINLIQHRKKKTKKT